MSRKLLPLPRLKKKLWRIFSEYIRRKEADINGRVECFSCGAKKHWKEMDAGHFHPAGSSGLLLYFDERNVHPQCTACNRFRHGNLAEYATNMVKKFGEEILQDLKDIKHPVKWYREDYDKRIEHYSEEIKKLIQKDVFGYH